MVVKKKGLVKAKEQLLTLKSKLEGVNVSVTCEVVTYEVLKGVIDVFLGLLNE